MVNLISDTKYVIFTNKGEILFILNKKTHNFIFKCHKVTKQNIAKLVLNWNEGRGGAQYNQKVKIDQINVLNEKIKTSFI